MKKLVFLFILILFSACLDNNTLKQIKFSDQNKIKVNIEGHINKPGLYLVDLNSDLNNLLKLCNGYLNDSEILDNIIFTKDTDIFINSNRIKDKYNLNNISTNDLIKVDGIGESIAHKIIEYRQIYGDFKSVSDLKNIKGIKDKLFNKIYHYFKV